MVVIDCDLQHPPGKIVEMYRLWQEGYEVVEGIYDSYCDHFEQPYTDYDLNTAHQFDSALEADDYARKRFFELQKEVQNEDT